MIEVRQYTPSPITYMGKQAAICRGNYDISALAAREVGRKVWNQQHNRVLEYPDITMTISKYSARVIRELYTHIIGVTRLQESTRYVQENDFTYITPPEIIGNEDSFPLYNHIMQEIYDTYLKLIEVGISVEDAAMILPLGMETTVSLKINLRALVHLAEQRACTKSYWEMRNLVNEIIDAIKSLDDIEWQILAKRLMPKCARLTYCPESESCGLLKVYSKQPYQIENNEFIEEEIDG